MSRYTASTVIVIGLHHAGVHVTNLERSVAFDEAVFELRVSERLALGPERPALLVAGRARVELIADGAAGRATGVVDHLAFEVDDLDGWGATAQGSGRTVAGRGAS
jgi:catechol 2,3-dioxygenase-like lactoylglutathione lyase family enzyme